MATIDTRFDPTLDLGQPAFLQFWGNFLNVRSKLNEKAWQASLQAQNPRDLLALQGKLADNIARLQRVKAGMQEASLKAGMATDKLASQRELAIIKAAGQIEVAKTYSGTTAQVAMLRAKTDLITTMYENQSDTFAKVQQAKRDTVKPARRVARGAEEGGDYKTALGAMAELRGGLTEGSEEDVGTVLAFADAAEAEGKPGLAAAFRSKLGPGAAGLTEDQFLADRYNAYSIDQMEGIADGSINQIGSGGGMSGFLGSLSQSGIQVDPDTIDGLAGAESRVSYRRGVRGQPGGHPGAPGRGTVAPTVSPEVASIDAQIKSFQDQLEDLTLQRQAKSPTNYFSGFMSNALFETRFVKPPRDTKAAHDVFMNMTDRERTLVAQALEQAGGDFEKAKQILTQARTGQDVAPSPSRQQATEPPPSAPLVVEPPAPQAQRARTQARPGGGSVDAPLVDAGPEMLPLTAEEIAAQERLALIEEQRAAAAVPGAMPELGGAAPGLGGGLSAAPDPSLYKPPIDIPKLEDAQLDMLRKSLSQAVDSERGTVAQRAARFAAGISRDIQGDKAAPLSENELLLDAIESEMEIRQKRRIDEARALEAGSQDYGVVPTVGTGYVTPR
jgi:hypothetical protein